MQKRKNRKTKAERKWLVWYIILLVSLGLWEATVTLVSSSLFCSDNLNRSTLEGPQALEKDGINSPYSRDRTCDLLTTGQPARADPSCSSKHTGGAWLWPWRGMMSQSVVQYTSVFTYIWIKQRQNAKKRKVSAIQGWNVKIEEKKERKYLINN